MIVPDAKEKWSGRSEYGHDRRDPGRGGRAAAA